jgi:hypothetical protein
VGEEKNGSDRCRPGTSHDAHSPMRRRTDLWRPRPKSSTLTSATGELVSHFALHPGRWVTVHFASTGEPRNSRTQHRSQNVRGLPSPSFCLGFVTVMRAHGPRVPGNAVTNQLPSHMEIPTCVVASSSRRLCAAQRNIPASAQYSRPMSCWPRRTSSPLEYLPSSDCNIQPLQLCQL